MVTVGTREARKMTTKDNCPWFWVWSRPQEGGLEGEVDVYFKLPPNDAQRELLLTQLEALDGITYLDLFPGYLTLYWSRKQSPDGQVSTTVEIIERVAEITGVAYPCNYGVISTALERDRIAATVGNVIWFFRRSKRPA